MTQTPEQIEGMCENIIGLHSGYTRERCEALRDLALKGLQVKLMLAGLAALRAASSLSQEEWEILLHALDCIDEGHEALRAKVRELASAPGPGPVEKADIPVTR